jgi:ABC-type nitrate/sulfonate/bicarbonate transport system substrate-binding protein
MPVARAITNSASTDGSTVASGRNNMRKTLTTGAALLAMVTGATAQQTPTKVNISLQPALYSMFPIFLAGEKGWWKEIGLDPTFSSFPAGPPQVAAAAAKTWDVGATGSAPGVLGATRFNIKTIGLTNDESATNTMMARPADAKEIKADPVAALKGKQILITVNTTVDYVLQACLKKWGMQRSDVQVVNLAQPQIISGMSSGEGKMMGLWAPNIYTVEERLNAEPVCSGKDAGAIVPSNIIVREDYLKENPEAVAKYLAVFLRGIAWSKANRAETVKLMDKFYQQGGVTVSEKALNAEIDRRPTFTLEEQVKLFDRAAGASTVDGWFKGLGDFLQSVGTIQAAPDSKTYLTDEVLKRIMADEKLRNFAMNK